MANVYEDSVHIPMQRQISNIIFNTNYINRSINIRISLFVKLCRQRIYDESNNYFTSPDKYLKKNPKTLNRPPMLRF